jgi:hypothetical protein
MRSICSLAPIVGTSCICSSYNISWKFLHWFKYLNGCNPKISLSNRYIFGRHSQNILWIILKHPISNILQISAIWIPLHSEENITLQPVLLHVAATLVRCQWTRSGVLQFAALSWVTGTELIGKMKGAKIIKGQKVFQLQKCRPKHKMATKLMCKYFEYFYTKCVVILATKIGVRVFVYRVLISP